MSKTSSRSTGGYQGTVTHVPPERWLNVNLQQNQMEDVYAFGILLWEIFTEEMPFSKLCEFLTTEIFTICISIRSLILTILPLHWLILVGPKVYRLKLIISHLHLNLSYNLSIPS